MGGCGDCCGMVCAPQPHINVAYVHVFCHAYAFHSVCNPPQIRACHTPPTAPHPPPTTRPPLSIQSGCGVTLRTTNTTPTASSLLPLYVDELAGVASVLQYEEYHVLGDGWGGMLVATAAAQGRLPGAVSLTLLNTPPSYKQLVADRKQRVGGWVYVGVGVCVLVCVLVFDCVILWVGLPFYILHNMPPHVGCHVHHHHQHQHPTNTTYS